MKANESYGWQGHTIEKLAKCLEKRRDVHPRLSPLPLAMSCAAPKAAAIPKGCLKPGGISKNNKTTQEYECSHRLLYSEGIENCQKMPLIGHHRKDQREIYNLNRREHLRN